MSISRRRRRLMGGGTIGAGLPTPAFTWNAEEGQTPPGSVTFTRATAATVLTTTDGVTNWYQEAKSGEIRYEGLRRVSNDISNSGAYDSFAVGWVPLGGASTAGSVLTLPSVNSFAVLFSTTDIVPSRQDAAWGVFSLSGSGTVTVRIADNFSSAASIVTQQIALSGTPTTYAVHTDDFGGSSTGTSAALGVVRATGDTATSVTIHGCSVVRSQKGSGSLPPELFDAAETYNANVPGVRYFNTTNGNSVDGNGVVTEAAGTTITGGGYLAEPSSTNQLSTVDLTNVAWTKTNTSVTDDGVNSLGLRQYTVDAGVTGVLQHRLDITASSSLSGTGYVIAKQGTEQFLSVRRGGASTDYAIFDLDAGTVSEEGSGISSSFMIPLGDGWFVCGVTTSDTSNVFRIGISNTGTPGTATPAFAGANETVLVAHAQYEGVLFPTSPIVTSGSTVTRNQDDMTGSNWIATAPYSLFSDNTAPTILLSTAASESPIFQTGSSINDRLRFGTDVHQYVTFSGGTTALVSGSVTAGERFKSALRVALDDASLVKSGLSPNIDNSTGTLKTGDVKIGKRSINSHRGIIHKVQSYSGILTDAQLETLVT